MSVTYIVTSTDFSGYYSIDIASFSANETEAFINKLETKYLKKLLGNKLYDEYAANQDEEKWLKLVNGTQYTDYIGQTRELEPDDLKNMLLGFIYFELVKADKDKQTTTGYIRPDNQNSKPVGKTESVLNMIERFNDSVILYRKAYNFIYCTKNTYDWSGWMYTSIAFKELIRY
jgi:hypothetical protein